MFVVVYGKPEHTHFTIHKNSTSVNTHSPVVLWVVTEVSVVFSITLEEQKSSMNCLLALVLSITKNKQ